MTTSPSLVHAAMRLPHLPTLSSVHLPLTRLLMSAAATPAPRGSPEPRVRLAIELAFGPLMNIKERSSLQRQMVRAYGNNKKAPKPLDLYFTATEEAEEYHRRDDSAWAFHPTWDAWDCTRCKEPAINNWSRDELVWLSPDADEPLLELSSDDVYVVAGLIDKSVIKNHTRNLAHVSGARAVRLPIKEFAPVGNVHPILDVVTVTLIMAEVHSGASWASAFEKHLPSRLVRRREREQQLQKEGKQAAKSKPRTDSDDVPSMPSCVTT